jgi:cysteine-rich repeat protein
MRPFALASLIFSLCACSGPPTGGGGDGIIDAGTAEPNCGDGVVDGAEACDDGNSASDDACLNDCTLARCGDAITRMDLSAGETGFEACDDGNSADDDGCLAGCIAARCGDGITRADLSAARPNFEACDDGNNADDDACTNGCTVAACGDGILRTDLSVADANFEACDDGNEVAEDACTDRCEEAICGDAIARTDLDLGVDGFEGCDDGNDADDDACTSACAVARCGDAIIRTDVIDGGDGFEACDDGNEVAADACTDSCAEAVCGDAIMRLDLGAGDDGFEACDDGNAADDDACTNTCAEAACGDAILRGDLRMGDRGYEACDDGDELDENTCTNACTLARCGDGIVRGDIAEGEAGYEACDDGNGDNDDACTNSCVRGDIDGTFEGAIELVNGLHRGVINPARDLDYVQFEGVAGAWMMIHTIANARDDNTMVDTVVTLYDANRNQIAESDDATPRVSTDSELFTRLPADGTYYIRVMEFSHWRPGQPPEGSPRYTYELRLTPLADNRPRVVLAAENGDASTALEAGGSRLILADFNAADDVDNFSLTLAEGFPRFSAAIMPSGTTGHGSAQVAARLELIDEQDRVVARIDQTVGRYDLAPYASAGNFRLRLTPLNFRPGSNAFYTIKFAVSAGNPREDDNDANNERGGAQALTMNRTTNGSSGFIGNDLGPNDIDFFSFPAVRNQTVTIVCSSAHHGTSLRWLTADVQNGQGQTIGRATETDDAMVLMRNIRLADAGTHYLRLSASGHEQQILNAGARCGVHITNPAP